MRTITEPGIYPDLPAKDYHRQHDWLSWSMSKHLLPPSTPAHFKAALGRAGQEEPNRTFDLGKVVHALVLGDGDEFEIVQALTVKKEPYDAKDYKSVSAQTHRDLIYAEGKVPILRTELDDAEAMAKSVREHSTANALLTNGTPEVSLFWIDDETGVKLRARLDWMPEQVKGRRMIVPDVKTAATAAPSDFAKAVANFAYYGQHLHYLDGIRALGIDHDPAFVFVAIEKTDPYLVSVIEALTNKGDQGLARALVDHTRRLYAECTATDKWPGYGEQVHRIEMPTYWRYRMEEELAS